MQLQSPDATPGCLLSLFFCLFGWVWFVAHARREQQKRQAYLLCHTHTRIRFVVVVVFWKKKKSNRARRHGIGTPSPPPRTRLSPESDSSIAIKVGLAVDFSLRSLPFLISLVPAADSGVFDLLHRARASWLTPTSSDCILIK